jgi:hypothetical protein
MIETASNGTTDKIRLGLPGWELNCFKRRH